MEAPEHLQVMGFEKGKGCGDHFLVEDLLDFSNGGMGVGEGEGEGEGDEELGLDSSCSAIFQSSAESSSAIAPIEYCSSTSPVSGPREPHFLGEDLCVPYDELAELEWLSHFVEDSFSADSSSHKLHPLPSTTTTTITMTNNSSTLTTTTTPTSIITTTTTPTATTNNATCYTPTSPSPPLFTSDPPVRCARSKRCRSAPRDWASRLLVLTPPTNPIPTEASLLSAPLPPPSPTPTPTHIHENNNNNNHNSNGNSNRSGSSSPPPPTSSKKPSKAPKKHHLNALETSLAPNPDGRKCLHCSTDKTPQWRTGPMGPKTLCNACGVRYKSGRLVPEYRPAASPTFVLSEHSNSHRKVMELRRQKEILLQQQQQQHQHVGGNNIANNGDNGLFMGHHFQPQNGGGYYEGGDDFLIHNHLGPDFRQLI